MSYVSRVLQRNLGALVRMLQCIPLLGTVVSAVFQKLPLTSRLFCLWWHVSGTVGCSLKSSTSEPCLPQSNASVIYSINGNSVHLEFYILYGSMFKCGFTSFRNLLVSPIVGYVLLIHVFSLVIFLLPYSLVLSFACRE
jgi:hypothetical protein